MELFNKMLPLQMQLLCLMLIGIAVKKALRITAEQQKGFSTLLINLILPANILSSFLGGGTTGAVLRGLLEVLVISVLIQAAASVLSPLVFKRYPETKSHVMSYGMIVSNSSFIGIPIAEVIYGDAAVMMTSVFQIPIRITMWTAGLSLFTTDHDPRGKIKKMVTHPCIIAVFAGLVVMLCGIRLPAVAVDTISTLGRCTTGLSMLIIGMILAEIDFRSCFTGDALFFSAVRLLAYPALVLAALKLARMDPMTVSISAIMTSMPAGSTTAILAKQYGYDSEYAAKIVLVSTLLSVVTIPIICLFI